MNLLILYAYYKPEQVASSYLFDNLEDAFSSSKINVEIYTPTPCRGVSEDIRRLYKKRRIEYTHDGKLKVCRFPMFSEIHNPITRAFRYFLCCCKHLYYGMTAKNIDVLFLASTPPIQGAMGGLIRKWCKIPFIYNLQDIFPDSLVGTGLAKKGGMLWKIGRVIENFTYKHADKIIVISEDFKRNIMAKGVPEEKIEVIYNWVDEMAVVPIPADENPLHEEFGLERDKFYIVYAGNLGSAQNIDIILDAAQKLLGSDITFLIFGNVEQAKPFKQKAQDMNLTNVRFLPIQPYERVSCVYSLGNAAIVPCKKGFGSIGMPSKTWSIMSSATAVLASFDSGTDMQRIVEENQVGLFTEANDLNAFTEAILQLRRNPQACYEMGQHGRQFILKNLTREVGTSKYIKIIEEVYNSIDNKK